MFCLLTFSFFTFILVNFYIQFRFMRSFLLFNIVLFNIFMSFSQNMGSQLPVFLRDNQNYDFLDTIPLNTMIGQKIWLEKDFTKNDFSLENLIEQINEVNLGGLVLSNFDPLKVSGQIKKIKRHVDYPIVIATNVSWGSNTGMSMLSAIPDPVALGSVSFENKHKILIDYVSNIISSLGFDLYLGLEPAVVQRNIELRTAQSFSADAGQVVDLVGEMTNTLKKRNIVTGLSGFPGAGDVYQKKGKKVVEKPIRTIKIVDLAPYNMAKLNGLGLVQMGDFHSMALDSLGDIVTYSQKSINYLKNDFRFNGLVMSCNLLKSQPKNNLNDGLTAFLAGNNIIYNPKDVMATVNGIKTEALSNEKIKNILKDDLLLIYKLNNYISKKQISENSDLSVEDAFNLQLANLYIAENSIFALKNNNAVPVKIVNNIGVYHLGSQSYHFDELTKKYADVETYNLDAILGKVNIQDLIAKHDVNVFVVDAAYFDFLDELNLLLANGENKKSNILILKQLPFNVNLNFDNFDGVLTYAYDGLESQNRMAQAVFGGIQVSAKLPFDISEELPAEFGLKTPKASRFKYALPEEIGVDSKKLDKIEEIVNHGISEKAFPGCQVFIAKDGVVIYDKSFGKLTYEGDEYVTPETIYDVASITKIISSTMALMKLNDDKLFKLDSKLYDYLDFVKGTPYENVILKDMMTHQAGFSPWIPFYTKTLVGGKPNPNIYSSYRKDENWMPVSSNLYIHKSYEDTMINRILSTSIKPGKNYKYSDLGYYFVKKIVEKQSKTTLDDFVKSNFYEPMYLKSMGYNPMNYYDISKIAPSEQDGYFRHELVRGYVHDMGAAMTGGVGGHAGVFSNAHDLGALMQMLLNDGVYGGVDYLSKNTIKSYTSCQFCPKNRRGAGFDKPTIDLKGGPTTNLVSLESFGHTGFTGTQVWADPKYNINYVFLSNRVYPSAENWKLVKMNIRTDIQKVIYEALL